jgi:hypothetical protein
VDTEKGYRYISEQVCHSIPISACHCESPDYSFWTEINVKSKFWGKSLEFYPLGTCHVNLPIFKGGFLSHVEHFTWKKVTTCINNIIMGNLWIDHCGDMIIKNWQTKEECCITFKRRSGGSWFGWNTEKAEIDPTGGLGELEGWVKNAQGDIKWELRGSWDSKLTAFPVDKNQSPIVLWTRTPLPSNSADNFNFTSFAIGLNEISSELKTILPPSDCRLRPDQRAMEMSAWEEATEGKENLEKRQREQRKILVQEYEKMGMANGPQDRLRNSIPIGEEWWIPRWFVRKVEFDTGEEHWEFTGDYWKQRLSVQNGGEWPEWVPKLFLK